MELIVIYWHDACMYGGATQCESDIKEYSLMELISAGILINETEYFYTVGSDYCEKENTFRHVNVYPKSGILKVRKIKIGK